MSLNLCNPPLFVGQGSGLANPSIATNTFLANSLASGQTRTTSVAYSTGANPATVIGTGTVNNSIIFDGGSNGGFGPVLTSPPQTLNSSNSPTNLVGMPQSVPISGTITGLRVSAYPNATITNANTITYTLYTAPIGSATYTNTGINLQFPVSAGTAPGTVFYGNTAPLTTVTVTPGTQIILLQTQTLAAAPAGSGAYGMIVTAGVDIQGATGVYTTTF